jgi:hypothetical protein
MVKMTPAETKGTPLDGSSHSVAKGMSRRELIERLRRAAIFVAPVVATLALKTPKAIASRP